MTGDWLRSALTTVAAFGTYFCMYVGYLGYVAVLFARSAIQGSGSLLDLFRTVAWVVAIGGACCFGAAGAWFLRVVRVDAGAPSEAEELQRRQRLAIARK